MTRAVACAVAAAIVACAGVAHAHEFAPGVLELRVATRSDGTEVALALRVGLPSANLVSVELPSDCRPLAAPTTERDDRHATTRWAVRCAAASLAGRVIRLRGLDAAGIDLIVRAQLADGALVERLVRAGSPSLELPATASWRDTARDYLIAGVGHILFGADHLLFVICLLIAARARHLRARAAILTAFTIGHSITLCLAATELVRLPQSPTEVLIALSIALLAATLVRTAASPPLPYLLASGFGLVHGLGFAGALHELGLPDGQAAPALVAFNIGIELGQLAFAAAALAIAGVASRLASARVTTAGRTAVCYAAGAMAMYWAVERVLAI